MQSITNDKKENATSEDDFPILHKKNLEELVQYGETLLKNVQGYHDKTQSYIQQLKIAIEARDPEKADEVYGLLGSSLSDWQKEYSEIDELLSYSAEKVKQANNNRGGFAVTSSFVDFNDPTAGKWPDENIKNFICAVKMISEYDHQKLVETRKLDQLLGEVVGMQQALTYWVEEENPLLATDIEELGLDELMKYIQSVGGYLQELTEQHMHYREFSRNRILETNKKLKEIADDY